MNKGFGRSLLVLAAAVGGISLLLWAGVQNLRDRRLAAQHASAAPATLVRDQHDAASEAGDGSNGAPRLEGKLAPGFTLVDLDGKTVSLADFKGKPVLVNFWASWCGPCKLEMPWFEEFHKKYEGDGLVILGVAADDAGKSTIASTAKRTGVTYPILLKDDKVEDAYGGINYLPQSFYVDRKGSVLIETAGMNDGQGGKDEIEANIKRLLATNAQ